MSYYAVHHLSWDDRSVSEEDIVARLQELTEESGESVRSMALDGEEANWRDSDEHATALSLEHPGTLFTLSCKGEDGRHTVTFFRGGMMQTVEVEPQPFDEKRFAAHCRPGPVPKKRRKA